MSQLPAAMGLQFQSLAEPERGCPPVLNSLHRARGTPHADSQLAAAQRPAFPTGEGDLGAQATAG